MFKDIDIDKRKEVLRQEVVTYLKVISDDIHKKKVRNIKINVY